MSVMYITSRREGSVGDFLDPIDGKYYEDIYMCINDGDKKRPDWSAPINMYKPLNTRYHESVVGLSKDGKLMYIFRDDRSDPTNGGDICISKLEEGKTWTKPERMGKEVNSKYTERSFAIAADGKMMFFVSNRPDGYGGTDIYMSRKNEDGSWSPPSNLDSTINTEHNEDGIFFHSDGKTLYFSSKGHNTMGGYDIFKTTMEENRWSAPQNLGYPINTPDDDIYYIESANGKFAWFSSVREDEGVGEKDIYMITYKVEEEKFLTLLKGQVRDKQTKKPLEATIELMDIKKNELIAQITSQAKTGKYEISVSADRKYGIYVYNKNYIAHSEDFSIPWAEDDQEIVKNVDLEKIKVGATVILKNIFFDFNRRSLRPKSQTELDRLYDFLVENKKVKIEIGGHTDNKGSDEYNQLLSERRAQSVVTLLIEKGISIYRLSAKGYGEYVPIAPNENPDGSDNPEGRQLNRRTEFKIMQK